MSLAAVAPGVDLPASGLAERVGNMDTAEIQKRVNRVERWHYKFDLNGISTPISDKTRITDTNSEDGTSLTHCSQPLEGLSQGSGYSISVPTRGSGP